MAESNIESTKPETTTTLGSDSTNQVTQKFMADVMIKIMEDIIENMHTAENLIPSEETISKLKSQHLDSNQFEKELEITIRSKFDEHEDKIFIKYHLDPKEVRDSLPSLISTDMGVRILYDGISDLKKSLIEEVFINCVSIPEYLNETILLNIHVEVLKHFLMEIKQNLIALQKNGHKIPLSAEDPEVEEALNVDTDRIRKETIIKLGIIKEDLPLYVFQAAWNELNDEPSNEFENKLEWTSAQYDGVLKELLANPEKEDNIISNLMGKNFEV